MIVYLILNTKEMINFGNNLEEFIKDFKERVVENACCSYPKDYRKSDKYLEQNLDEKFNEALNSSYGKRAILDVMESYYNTIHEYEENLGY